MKTPIKANNLILFESALYRTTTTLIIGSDYIALIDPNWLPIEIEVIYEQVLLHGEGKQKYLIFTHSDYDHIIAYGRFEGFRCIASGQFVALAEKAKIIKEINDFDDEYYIRRKYPIKYPEIQISIQNDGQSLLLGREEYHFYFTPGHTRDGIAILNKSRGLLIVGDYLSNIEFPFIYDSFHSYQATINKLESIIDENKVQLLIPGHGDFSSNKNEMLHRIKESRDYLSALEEEVLNNKPLNPQSLTNRYGFGEALLKSHRENLKLVKTELEV